MVCSKSDSSYYVKGVIFKCYDVCRYANLFCKAKQVQDIHASKWYQEFRIEAFGTELGCGVYTNSFASLCITYDVTTSIRQDGKSLWST